MSMKDCRIPEADRPPAQFWTDFGNFCMATYNYVDTDDYWETLCHWADILLERYNNPAANKVVFDYLNSQSARACRQNRLDWRAHRGNETANNSQIRVG